MIVLHGSQPIREEAFLALKWNKSQGVGFRKRNSESPSSESGLSLLVYEKEGKTKQNTSAY